MAGFHYAVGGLAVRSAFPLEGLQARHDETETDIEVVLTDSLPSFLSGKLDECFQWPGRYGLRLAETSDGWLFSTGQHGCFAVPKDGQSVHCIPGGAFGSIDSQMPASVPDGLCQVLMRRILPRVLQLHGRLGLHGASITTAEGDAFLLLGPSGAGKSTLSVALHHHLGWDVLSDDISLVDVHQSSCHCFPVVKGASLWPDSLATLAPSPQQSRPLPGHAGKFWRPPDRESIRSSAPLKAVVFLEKSDDKVSDIYCERLTASQGLRLAMRQLIRFNPRDGHALSGLMAQVSRLCQSAPPILLTYPRRYDMLSNVAGRLRLELAAMH